MGLRLPLARYRRAGGATVVFGALGALFTLAGGLIALLGMDASAPHALRSRPFALQEIPNMFPWLWIWAPHVYLPFSGSVTQEIAPDTDWFFAGIAPAAGDARIERRAFAVASYGRQLGLITEALLALAEQAPPASRDARESIARLREIRDEIERIKGEEVERWADALVQEVRGVQQRGGAKAHALRARVRPLLESPA